LIYLKPSDFRSMPSRGSPAGRRPVAQRDGSPFLPDEKFESAGSPKALDIDQAATGEALPDMD
jgi:hypothetical protein